MFFYVPFFMFAATLILALPDLGYWAAGLYVALLFGPRIWRTFRNQK